MLVDCWIISFVYTLSVVESVTRNISGVTVDLQMQRVLLDRHNQLRNEVALNGISTSGQPTATYMNKLHWDPVLAATAQQFTDRCSIGQNGNRVNDFKGLDSPKLSTFDYPNILYLGENYLWYQRTNGTIYEDAVNFAKKYWWDQHLDYNYCSKACSGICSSYTQMAWANTRYVGCGASICPSGSYQYLFLMCQYYPGGHSAGRHPYQSGAPCSDCATLASDRAVCDGRTSGLCSGCQAPGWNLCDDTSISCASLGCPHSGCKRSCNSCPTAQLSPSPTCVPSNDGLPI